MEPSEFSLAVIGLTRPQSSSCCATRAAREREVTTGDESGNRHCLIVLHLTEAYFKDINASNSFLKVRWNAECGVRSAECGVRSVENAKCRKCGVWKTRSVENAEW